MFDKPTHKLSSGKIYFFNSDDMGFFEVKEYPQKVTLIFYGEKIKYMCNGKEEDLNYFDVSLLKENNKEGYNYIFESNSSLKSKETYLKMQELRKKEYYNEWKLRVYSNNCKKGDIYLSFFTTYPIFDIYVDEYLYAKAKPSDGTFAFQLPYGKYNICLSTGDTEFKGLDLPAGCKSNTVKIELSDYTPQVCLRAKPGFGYSIKLKVI